MGGDIEVTFTQREITTVEAYGYVLDPRRGDNTFDVLGAAVTSDCPEDHDYDADGYPICDHIDGVTLDEVAVAYEEGTVFDEAAFASYGPFFLQVYGEEPGEPQPPRIEDVIYIAMEAGRFREVPAATIARIVALLDGYGFLKLEES